MLRVLWRRGLRKVGIFLTDDLPGLEEATRKIFPEANRQLCVLHPYLDQARKKYRENPGRGPKVVYQAETEEEAKEALERLREC